MQTRIDVVVGIAFLHSRDVVSGLFRIISASIGYRAGHSLLAKMFRYIDEK